MAAPLLPSWLGAAVAPALAARSGPVAPVAAVASRRRGRPHKDHAAGGGGDDDEVVDIEADDDGRAPASLPAAAPAQAPSPTPMVVATRIKNASGIAPGVRYSSVRPEHFIGVLRSVRPASFCACAYM
jgi:hypothetical protein